MFKRLTTLLEVQPVNSFDESESLTFPFDKMAFVQNAIKESDKLVRLQLVNHRRALQRELVEGFVVAFDALDAAIVRINHGGMAEQEIDDWRSDNSFMFYHGDFKYTVSLMFKRGKHVECWDGQ